MVVARIESFILDDTLEDAITRAKAYVNSGADGVMIHSRNKSGDDIKSFCLEFRKINQRTPIVVVPSSYNHIKESELISWGANIVIYANHLLRSSFPKMQSTIGWGQFALTRIRVSPGCSWPTSFVVIPSLN